MKVQGRMITLGLVITACLLFPVAAGAYLFSNQSVVDEIIALTNQERANAGLSALQVGGALTWVADRNANNLDFYNQSLNSEHLHTASPAGWQSFNDRTNLITWSGSIGENEAWGYTSAAAVMAAWMGSAGHRANILNSAFTHIGVGAVDDYYVQFFAGSDGYVKNSTSYLRASSVVAGRIKFEETDVSYDVTEWHKRFRRWMDYYSEEISGSML
jgi:hypothetical protein